jgi:hypothetical protein
MRLSAESALEAMRTQGSLPIYAHSSTKIELSSGFTPIFLALSAMIRRIRVIRVLLTHSLLRTLIPVYLIENRPDST